MNYRHPAEPKTAPYHKLIAPLARGYDPRHIEAYMRVAHSTLDRLPPDQFAQEVEIGIGCIVEGGKANAEALARSFGF